MSWPLAMLEGMSLDALLDAVSSDAPSPGSGTAAAAALGLGVACLGKAVAVTLKGQPDTTPDLQAARARIDNLMAQSIRSADADARGFPRLLTARRAHDGSESAKAAEDLTALADTMVHLCEQIEAEADRLAPLLKPTMASDLLAARLLARAACAIARANHDETAGVARRLGGGP